MVSDMSGKTWRKPEIRNIITSDMTTFWCDGHCLGLGTCEVYPPV